MVTCPHPTSAAVPAISTHTILADGDAPLTHEDSMDIGISIHTILADGDEI